MPVGYPLENYTIEKDTENLTVDHVVVYEFRGYRCRFVCSCSQDSTLLNSYLHAWRAARRHLEQVGGDIDQPYRSQPWSKAIMI